METIQVTKSENIPKMTQEKYIAIVKLTNSIFEENLNEEYGQIIRYAVAALCRKRGTVNLTSHHS